MKTTAARAGVPAPGFNWLLGQMPLVALIVLCIIASLLSGRFLSGINITNVLMQGAVLTVITIGMTYVIIAGGFDLSVGSVVALSGVSMAVWPGEVHCLLGDNGAGKSTLIKTLSGVHKPSSGRILLDGRPTELDSPRDALDRGIATVFQDLAMIPLMSITRNFFMGREPTKGAGPFRRFDVAAANLPMPGVEAQADVVPLDSVDEEEERIDLVNEFESAVHPLAVGCEETERQLYARRRQRIGNSAQAIDVKLEVLVKGALVAGGTDGRIAGFSSQRRTNVAEKVNLL